MVEKIGMYSLHFCDSPWVSYTLNDFEYNNLNPNLQDKLVDLDNQLSLVMEALDVEIRNVVI